MSRGCEVLGPQGSVPASWQVNELSIESKESILTSDSGLRIRNLSHLSPQSHPSRRVAQHPRRFRRIRLTSAH
jgi:hypothetical protein